MEQQHSQALQLLGWLALCGELPAAVIHRLPMKKSYQYKIIAALKQQKYIRLFQRDHLKAYRLTAAGKKRLMQDAPARYGAYLHRPGRSERNRRLRLHAAAQAYATVYNAGIPLFCDEKPPWPPSGMLQPSQAVFYDAAEIKAIGLESKKIRSSRAVGFLLYPQGGYLMYHTGGTIMKWESQTEFRMYAVMEGRLSKSLPFQARDRPVAGLMLGDNMDTAYQLLTSDGGRRHDGFRPEGSFPRFLYCPTAPDGEAQLRLLVSPEWEQIRQWLLSGLSSKAETFPIEHDAWESGRPVLLALDFDLPRLKRFHDALGLFGRTGQVVCFDFQAPALQKYLNGLAEIQVVSLEKTERRFLR